MKKFTYYFYQQLLAVIHKEQIPIDKIKYFMQVIKSRRNIFDLFEQKQSFQIKLDIIQHEAMKQIQVLLEKQQSDNINLKEFKNDFKELITIDPLYIHGDWISQKQFTKMVKNLSLLQKISFYQRYVTSMNIASGKIQKPLLMRLNHTYEVVKKGSFSKFWKSKIVNYDQNKNCLYISEEKKIKSYNLGHYWYLLPEKEGQYYVIMLKATRSDIAYTSLEVELGFTNQKSFTSFCQSVINGINEAIFQEVKSGLIDS